MSKAGSAGGGKSGEKAVAREFVLKVAMHCRCQGCTPKLRSAVNKLRRQPGVVTVDQSATEAAEELRVVAAADPEGLRKLVNKAMGNKKKVDLVLTPPKPIKKASGRGSSGNKDPRLVDARPVQVRRADDSCPPSSREGRVLATADTERLRKRVNKPTGKKVDSLILIPPESINKSSGGGWSEKAEPRLVNAHPCPPSSGEVRVLATVDTERLRKRVNKPTGKKVDIIFPPKPINKSSGGGSSKKEDPNLVDAPAMKELQADPQLETVPVSDRAYSCLPTSYYPGVLAVERKATESKEEMRVLATGSSERLRKRVNKPTGKKKKADPVFTPKPMPINKSSGGGEEGPRLVDAPAVMELEPDPQLEAVLANMWRVAPSLDRHRQYVGHGAAAALAGNNDQHHCVGHGLAAAAGAYPCPPTSYYPSQAEASASAYPTPAPAPPGYYCPPSAPPWPFGLDYN